MNIRVGCIWHLELRVSAVNRVVEETISIGMPIPRSRVKKKREVDQYCTSRFNKRRPTLAESFQNKIHSSTLCSFWLFGVFLYGPNRGTGESDRRLHTAGNFHFFHFYFEGSIMYRHSSDQGWKLSSTKHMTECIWIVLWVFCWLEFKDATIWF